MNIVKSLALAAVLATSAVGANAATIWATSVDSYTQGTNTMASGFIDPARTVQANATGTPDGKMLSLGFGGEVIVSFGKIFTAPGTLFEITNTSNPLGVLPYVEEAMVYLGKAGVFTYLTNIKNTTAVFGAPFGFVGKFDQIKLVDVSPTGRNRDGFDVDAISVTTVPAIPVPAAGLLLLTALGAFAALRRRTAA